MSETDSPVTAKPNRQRRVLVWMALIGIVAGSIGGGLAHVSTRLLVRAAMTGDSSAADLALGVQFARDVAATLFGGFITVWSVFGAGRWYARLLVGVLVLALALTAEQIVSSLAWRNWFEPDVPRLAKTILLIPGGLLLAQLPFLPFRLWFGYHFVHGQQSVGNPQARQFGIKDLIIAALVVAVSLSLARAACDLGAIDGDSGFVVQSLTGTALSIALTVGLGVFLPFVCYWLATRWWLRMTLYGAYWVGVPVVLCISLGGSRDLGYVVLLFPIWGVVTYLSHAVFRRVGYRLVRPRRRATRNRVDAAVDPETGAAAGNGETGPAPLAAAPVE